MFWNVRSANAIIALRCCQLSGKFEDYWESRQTGTSLQSRALDALFNLSQVSTLMLSSLLPCQTVHRARSHWDSLSAMIFVCEQNGNQDRIASTG